MRPATCNLQLVFLKLGGSAITDKTRAETPNPDVIREAARAVYQARAKNPDLRILLGHGSGSFGHFTAKKWGYGQNENWRAYAETGASAARLNRLVTDIFLEENVPVVSMQPSASARTRDGELIHLDAETIRTALDHNLIPLIYGDVAFDETRGMAIVSTDALFAYLAPILKPTRIVYTTVVNGIYTADPNKHPDAQLIREITPASFAEIRAQVGASHGYDVTGGMLDKLARSVALTEQIRALEVFVIGAQRENILKSLCESNPSNVTPSTYIYNPSRMGL
ncbi:MAG: isopentenyl phosphate kinase family protein [Chloroflexi bacterium]|nr:isopentenyl phosphate kinase family protein [Chloroflexota bacterium]